ncbi:pentatricopeptide repeat-containing protein At2g22410, mitochondrial-like [Magnolia sinica]|uniref:pentatricopeptide repeat-containing protein At2g22410, mitochondrial-like n=1 Tax=Magnolia sinica TaxID=86752 RepID=UPI002657E55D|nr:pentatricopeptide repeat-containing protein At2g22410, mitochondrial-like [Magnolia sinica]
MSKSIASKLILKNPCLPLLETCKNMAELKQIHAQIFRTGLSEDNLASMKILEICLLSNPPNLDYAHLVFDQIEAPNTSMWNTIIRAHSKAQNSISAVDFYKKMLKSGARPNGATLFFVLKACADPGSSRVLMGIHGQVFKLGFHSDIFILNSLIRDYSVCGSVDYARGVFDEIPERDLISWTILINSYVRSNRASEALVLFFLMRDENVRPDEVTFVAIFNACSQLGDLNLGRRLENLAHEIGIEYNSYVINSLIDMYAKCWNIHEAQRLFDKMVDRNVVSWNSMVSGYARCGNMEAARRLFDQMPEKNNVSWSALLNGYVQNDAFNKALMVFDEMQARAAAPNDAAITGVIAACAHLGALEMGRKIHVCLDERKVRSDIVLSTALVDMYAKCGCVEISRALFDGIEKKNLPSYNAMIIGLAIHGKTSDCLEILSEMVKDGIRPDGITFVGILSGCAHAGWLQEGKEYFDRMRTVYGITPRTEHYSCMVHLMGRAGLVNEAYEFIRSCPLKPDVAMWGGLLNACKVHGNVEVGELASRRILELDPGHGGAHVLLSSIYAAADKWAEVMKIRKKMKEIGIGNRPGWSSIEVDGMVHQFLVEDYSHSKIEEIFSTVGALHFQMVSHFSTDWIEFRHCHGGGGCDWAIFEKGNQRMCCK